MSFSPLVEKLMESLRVLPGVGPKTAQRMAMHLLERDRDGGRRLAAVLDEALERVGYCRRCRTLTEEAVCALCESARRDDTRVCARASCTDQRPTAEAGGSRGRYFARHCWPGGRRRHQTGQAGCTRRTLAQTADRR